MDEASGRVLQAYRADAPHPPASLTKMMTLYLTFEALEQGRITLNTPVEVTYRAAAQSPSKLYLQVGQQVTVEQLILAMTVRSANDAATAMGEFLGGDEATFAQRMTAKARELGMSSTTFRNANGLPAPGAYTTARDMATLARAIHKRFPKYSHYFSQRYFHWGARTFRNTNRLLHTRQEVTGMKTGYTRASGFNLVATAEYRDQPVILVVLGGRTSGQRYQQAEQLLAIAYRGLPARPPENTAVASRERNDVDEEEETEQPAAKPTTRKSFSLISRAEAGTRERVGDTGAQLRYGVDIGRYRSYGTAQNVAEKAYYNVPTEFRSGSTRIAVIVVKQGRRTQYAARLLGFNQSAASQTCRALARRGLRCTTMSYPLQSAAATSTATDASATASDEDEDRAYVAKAKAKAAKYARAHAKKHKKRYVARYN